MGAELVRNRTCPVDWANQAGAGIKLMCKHLLDLRASGTPYVSERVKHLLSLLRPGDTSATEEAMLIADAPAHWRLLSLLGPGDTSAMEEAMPIAGPPAHRRRLEKQASSASSVVFCGAHCRCPDCFQPPLVALQDEEQSGPALEEQSSASEAAYATDHAVPAQRGAVKKLLKRPAQALHPVPAESGAVKKLWKRPAQSNLKKQQGAGELKVSVVRRNTEGKQEAYIMVNNKYVVGLTTRRCASYVEVMERFTKKTCRGRHCAHKVGGTHLVGHPGCRHLILRTSDRKHRWSRWRLWFWCGHETSKVWWQRRLRCGHETCSACMCCMYVSDVCTYVP